MCCLEYNLALIPNIPQSANVCVSLAFIYECRRDWDLSIVTHADLCMNKLHFKWTGVVETKQPLISKSLRVKAVGRRTH